MNPIREFKWCTNFRDINKSCPKDNFPFPHIDMFVQSITGYGCFSFINGFLGNYIRINPYDMHKIVFYTPWDTFFYKFMPVGIKNTKATYQRDEIFFKYRKKIISNI